jgi:phage tail sheath protein FI
MFTADATSADWKLLAGRGENRSYLTKGSDGSAVTVGNYITGLDAFKNPEAYDVRIFMDGGITNHAFHTALVEMTKNRINSFAILSVDATAEKASSNRAVKVVNYRKEGLINSSYAGMYSPHVKIYDKYNDIYVEASPDGFVAGAIASNAEVFLPTAGWESGVIAVSGLTAVYEKEERDLLYDNGVNPIRQSSKKGTAIWGNKTLLTRASSLDRVNVRFAMITLEPEIMDFLDNFEFKINNEITRLLITSGADNVCKDLKSRGAFYDYYIVCNETNNTTARIQANELWCDVYVKPSISAEFIKFRAIVTTTGADFMAVQLG